jgi:hypothetical protein
VSVEGEVERRGRASPFFFALPLFFFRVGPAARRVWGRRPRMWPPQVGPGRTAHPTAVAIGGRQAGRPGPRRPGAGGSPPSARVVVVSLRARAPLSNSALTADIARADAADLDSRRRFLVHHGCVVRWGVGVSEVGRGGGVRGVCEGVCTPGRCSRAKANLRGGVRGRGGRGLGCELGPMCVCIRCLPVVARSAGGWWGGAGPPGGGPGQIGRPSPTRGPQRARSLAPRAWQARSWPLCVSAAHVPPTPMRTRPGKPSVFCRGWVGLSAAGGRAGGAQEEEGGSASLPELCAPLSWLRLAGPCTTTRSGLGPRHASPRGRGAPGGRGR